MQFNKRLLSAHEVGISHLEWRWGWGRDGGGKAEIQLEKGLLNWVNFKTDEECSISCLSKL